MEIPIPFTSKVLSICPFCGAIGFITKDDYYGTHPKGICKNCNHPIEFSYGSWWHTESEYPELTIGSKCYHKGCNCSEAEPARESRENQSGSSMVGAGV